MCDTTVTINYKDREQVERLAAAHYGYGFYSAYLHVRESATNDMQAALNAFANPTPTIEEPTGLGAVVEDTKGERWIRNNADVTHWLHAEGRTFAQRWRDLDVVRVLSEGIS